MLPAARAQEEWILAPIRSPLGLLVLAVAATIAWSGCSIRTSRTEHFVGPVLFRSSSQAGAPQISDVLRFGVTAEVGTQWGLTLGVSRRIAIAPGGDGLQPDAEGLRWTLPLQPGALDHSVPTTWRISWLYARLDGLRPPSLLQRVVYGAEVTLGPEASALSFGLTSRLMIDAPPNSVSLIRFNDRDPLASRVVVWTVRPDGTLPHTEILQEVHR